MLINNWYVAAESETLGEKPVGVKMLGQDFVLFRDADGAAHCLADTCIHRGGSLCRGAVVENTVQCPYHGWRFAGDGRCVEIPYVDRATRIPKRARVDAFPVKEHWGWVWVFLGDLPEAERPRLPGEDLFPEWYAMQQGSEEYRMVHGPFTFRANWTRAIENVLDPAHGFYVHSAFGNPNQGTVRPFEVVEDDNRQLARHRFKPVEEGREGPTWHATLTRDRDDADNQIQLYWPGLIFRNDLYPAPGLHHFVLSAYLPIDEHETLTIWYHARNFYTEPEHDQDAHRRVLQVFEEDAAVINYLNPVLPPGRPAAELALEADKHSLAFRRRVREYEARGWRIDTVAMATELDCARTIPSPARRENPRNWVLDTVPLIPPRGESEKLHKLGNA
jgi:phenylpropionate dioxygenase-like ring-hydroxylating dioxygenase large terminal subunit